MIDGIAVEDDELQRPRQFKDAFDFGLHLSDAVRARITALHQRSFRWIVEQRAFRQRNVGAYARNYDPANPIQRTNTCIYIHFKQLQQLQQHTNIHVATRASADKTESRAEANPHGRWIECIRTSVAGQNQPRLWVTYQIVLDYFSHFSLTFFSLFYSFTVLLLSFLPVATLPSDSAQWNRTGFSPNESRP